MAATTRKLRYTIKSSPEDFVVREISSVKISDKGRFTYFLLKKRDYTTLRAIRHIAESLNASPKLFNFAGIKDKCAVTEQIVSAKGVERARLENLKLKDIEVKYLGKGGEPVSTGDLEGNEFEITVRNVEKVPKLKSRFKNFFGQQRFSANNYLVGKAIIKKDFKKAVELIMENKGDDERMLASYLKEHPGNYAGGLLSLPKKLLKIYVHAYQSFLWNRLAEKFDDADTLPLIGFGFEAKDRRVKEEIEMLMKEEGISERDFIIKQLPGISAEGVDRALFSEARELAMEIVDNETIILRFRLKKGCYATVFIDQLFQEP